MGFRHLALALTLMTAACDRISGVRTAARLSQPADAQCVDRALRSVRGVGAVYHRTDRNESFQVTPYRGKIVSVIDQWQYGPDQRAYVSVSDDGKERSFFNGLEKMGSPWPASQLDAFVPLMKAVNAAVERDCGLPLAAVGRLSRN